MGREAISNSAPQTKVGWGITDLEIFKCDFKTKIYSCTYCSGGKDSVTLSIQRDASSPNALN